MKHKLTHQLTAKHVVLLLGVIAAVILLTSVGEFANLMTGDGVDKSDVTQSVGAKGSTKNNVDDPSMASTKIFGEAKSQTAQNFTPNTNGKFANIALKGVVVSENGSQSKAILSDPEGNTVVHYTAGSNLPNGAKLISVFPDRIIVKHGEEYQVVLLNQEITKGGIMPYLEQ